MTRAEQTGLILFTNIQVAGRIISHCFQDIQVTKLTPLQQFVVSVSVVVLWYRKPTVSHKQISGGALLS